MLLKLNKIFFILAVFFIVLAVAKPAFSAKKKAVLIKLEGAINPGSAGYVVRGIRYANNIGAELIIIQLDTPGGLASSMRQIIKAILNSRVPVVVYVAPSGAGAASAGAIVTISAHIAAMAPGTNIGAAHPVGLGGKDIGKTMTEKVVNDMASYARGIARQRHRNAKWIEMAIRESVSITAEEALKKHVIDLIADDISELLRKIDGRTVSIVGGKKIKINTEGISIETFKPDIRDRILKTISDPNIAYILMMIGLTGLYFELAHPGAILPGVLGAISLILAFYSFHTLPVNYAGLLLIALGIILFILEIKVTSYGMLTIGGIISLLLGSMMLFDNIKVSLSLIMPTVAMFSAFFLGITYLAIKAHREKPISGAEGLIGEKGVVERWEKDKGLVFVHGEYWNAESDEELAPGDKVEVKGIKGLTLNVKKEKKA
ncbi:MAG: nodulation protein NfeD [Deltaproteobacteria bacterium]|nr:MAG: nodulation protein NfeD [Deltaproteobacteria bacterium]